ncbi:zn-finger [Stylonychia lemnae]|uniref:Zn-finger n=1 Tax=Stylonychia lemnae TaxID=5949 RepID=A0A078AZL4_STYLE|nr:zn-finger [Stylonychia lemnae]|eukprot:CDW87541.1 zn-finger [Stylonychia lemnae]
MIARSAYFQSPTVNQAPLQQQQMIMLPFTQVSQAQYQGHGINQYFTPPSNQLPQTRGLVYNNTQGIIPAVHSLFQNNQLSTIPFISANRFQDYDKKQIADLENDEVQENFDYDSAQDNDASEMLENHEVQHKDGLNQLLSESLQYPLQSDNSQSDIYQLLKLNDTEQIQERNKQGKLSYKCPICKKSLTRRENVKNHLISIHLKIKRHQCKICQKKFSERSNLLVHLRIHDKRQPYQCQTCHKKFNSLGNMRDHERRHIRQRTTLKSQYLKITMDTQIYMRYVQFRKPQILQANSNITSNELAQIIAKEWSSMDQDQRNQIAQTLNQLNECLSQSCIQQNSANELQSTNESTQNKQVEYDMSPSSPTRLFYEEFIEKAKTVYPDHSEDYYIQIMSNQWNSMNQEAKQPYIAKSILFKQQISQQQEQQQQNATKLPQIINNGVNNQPQLNGTSLNQVNAQPIQQAKGVSISQLNSFPQLVQPLNINSNTQVKVSERTCKEAKRSLDARVMFSKQMKQAILTQYPQYPVADLVKTIELGWKKLSLAYKQMFINMTDRINNEQKVAKTQSESYYQKKKRLAAMGLSVNGQPIQNQLNQVISPSIVPIQKKEKKQKGVPQLPQVNLPIQNPINPIHQLPNGLNLLTQNQLLGGLNHSLAQNLGGLPQIGQLGSLNLNSILNPMLPQLSALQVPQPSLAQTDLSKILQVYQQNQLICNQLLMQASMPCLKLNTGLSLGQNFGLNPTNLLQTDDLKLQQLQQQLMMDQNNAHMNPELNQPMNLS